MACRTYTGVAYDITQIMNPLLLAPEIQEEILSLASITRGKDPIALRDGKLGFSIGTGKKDEVAFGHGLLRQ